jgi:hypothetical protein
MPDGPPPVVTGQSTPVVGPLSVTPLYTSTGDNIVWWDGVQWQELVAGVTTPPVPPTWDSASGGAIWDGGLTVWSA